MQVEEHPIRSSLPLVMHARVVTRTGGGPEKTILNSPRYLERLGYRGECLYLRPPGDEGFQNIEQRALQSQAPLHVLDDRGATDPRVFWHALRLCRKLRPAIWHGHDYKSNLLGLLLKRFVPMRMVSTVHGWVDHEGRMALYTKLDKAFLKRYERVICVSQDLHDTCAGAGVPANGMSVIPNAIDLDDYRRRLTQSQARDAVGIRPHDGLVIGAVGRLSPEKGFDVLIESLAILRQQGIEARLVIVGEGAEKENLLALAQQRGVGDLVTLYGFCADIGTMMQAFDVFALSSLREGLPNVVLEAMACETPVVATRVAQVPLIIQHGVDGLLVPLSNAEELAKALALALGDASLRQKLASAARQTIEERYSFLTRMQRMTAVYDELLGRPTTEPTQPRAVAAALHDGE